MELAVKVRDRGTGTAVITASGVIDLATHPVLERAATELIESGDTQVVLDLSDVSLCDSTGLSALIRLHRLAERARQATGHGWLRLAATPRQVRRVLEITDLTRLLSLYDTVAAAQSA